MDNNPLYHGQAGTARGSHILSPRPVYQRCGGGIHFFQDIFTSVTRYVKYKDKGILMLGYILFSISLHMLTRILIWYLKCIRIMKLEKKILSSFCSSVAFFDIHCF